MLTCLALKWQLLVVPVLFLGDPQAGLNYIRELMIGQLE